MKSEIILFVLFIFLNFFLAFASDLMLNYLSTNYGIVGSLKPYFEKKSVIGAATAAGLTILVALFINMLLSYMIFGFVIPRNNKELLYFCIIAFIVGYLLDFCIYKFKIFGNSLELFYKTAGVGLWGALSFLFTIIISYIIIGLIRKIE
jgi:hypothetical protein